jgi:uncharacterized membrane protein
MWALYSLLSAFTWASSDAFAKRAMQRGVDGPRILFCRYALSVPVLLPVLHAGLPALDRTFWLLHAPWIPLETTALYLYIHAIRVSPLSLTLPFLALTPAFLVFTGWAFLGETVGRSGLAGIGLVVAGSYVINLAHAERDLLGPFKAIFRERGTGLMVIAAALYSLTSLIGKVLVQHSSPAYFSLHYAIVMSLVLAPGGLRGQRGPPSRGGVGLVVLSALCFSLMILFHMLAIETATVAYMIALKRLSGTFGVIYGRVFFQERTLGQRLAGSVIMVVGALLILRE